MLMIIILIIILEMRIHLMILGMIWMMRRMKIGVIVNIVLELEKL